MKTLSNLLIIAMILRNGNCVSSHLWYDMPTKISATNTIYFKYQNYLDGSYHFGYDTGLSAQQSFREEIRLASGQVIGQYGFVDQHGVLRVTRYSAGQHGYRATHKVYYMTDAQPTNHIIGPVPFFKLLRNWPRRKDNR